MGSNIYDGMRQVPGWVESYLSHIRNGDSDVRAASRAEVSSHTIRQRYKSDPQFKTDYEQAHHLKEKNGPKLGRRLW